MDSIYFLTSSRTKLFHARYLARHYDVTIRPQTYYGKAYLEPRIEARLELLERSFKSALERWRSHNLPTEAIFFIEDTSVGIEALSDDECEVPGVEVKFWMRKITFEELDHNIIAYGGSRRAFVRSDVIMYVPDSLKWALNTKSEYLHFEHKVHGEIVRSEYSIRPNPLLPWLDERSFNKWFVPEGESLPLSLLGEDDASKHDFRAGSVGKMFSFLCDNGCIKGAMKRPSYVQLGIDKLHNRPSLLVCGLPCSGKTTLGEYLSENYGYHHIEASDYMRLVYHERHGLSGSVPLDEFADEALKAEPDIVVTQILHSLEETSSMPVVVTGFRGTKEIDIFFENYQGNFPLKLLVIQASSNVRFERGKQRNREEDPLDMRSFNARDQLQLEMGIAMIETMFRTICILNEGAKEEYYSLCKQRSLLSASMFDEDVEFLADLLLEEQSTRPRRLEEAIILAMYVQHQSNLTTTEIARLINETFSPNGIRTSKNNVSRYFNMRFHSYYRIRNGKPSKYSLSATGRSMARLLIRKMSDSLSTL